MRRLFLKGLLTNEVTITGDDANHLMYAMRAKSGDEVILVDDMGSKTAQIAAFPLGEGGPRSGGKGPLHGRRACTA